MMIQCMIFSIQYDDSVYDDSVYQLLSSKLLLQFAVILNTFILNVKVEAYMGECDIFCNNMAM